MGPMDRRSFLKTGVAAGAGVMAAADAFAQVPRQPWIAADLVIHNAKVLTVDAQDSIAQAVAVRNGRIMMAGDDDTIRGFVGRGTQVLDAQGAAVTPGIIDTHSHVQGYGRYLNEYVNLRNYRPDKISDICAKMTEACRDAQPGDWVVGHGFCGFLGGRPITKWDLDKACPGNPVLVLHTSGQYGVVNSQALKLSGITEETPDPPGGALRKDKRGRLTGILVHYPALWLLKRTVQTPQQCDEAVDRGCYEMLSAGVTSVQDNFIMFGDQYQAYLRAMQANRLPIRIAMMPYIVNEKMNAESVRRITPWKRDFLAYEGWKYAVDGGWGAHTALVYDTETNRQTGLTLHTKDQLMRMVDAVNAMGAQTASHCVGDAAVDFYLDCVEAALARNPVEDHRHRVEHCCRGDERLAERILRSGCVVSTQPSFLGFYAEQFNETFPHEEGERLLPVKMLRDAGIKVSFGADVPACFSHEPSWTLWAAVSRRSLVTGEHVGEGQRISREDALRCHTVDAAYINHEENEKGSVERGKLGDLVVWDKDFYTCTEGETAEMRPYFTIIDGKVAYSREGSPLSFVRAS